MTQPTTNELIQRVRAAIHPVDIKIMAIRVCKNTDTAVPRRAAGRLAIAASELIEAANDLCGRVEGIGA